MVKSLGTKKKNICFEKNQNVKSASEATINRN